MQSSVELAYSGLNPVMAAASAGWIAAANTINFAGLADNKGMFTLACGVAVAIALYSFTLPNTPPKGDAGPEVARATLLLRRGERSSIVIDFQATTLNVLNVDGSNDAATGTDSGMIQIEHDKQLYREYVHYLLSRSEPRLPAWFGLRGL